ncbi:MAG: T9SS type A sorting domain-containing protein [Bacteroidales bacterium]|nr:T9SS type A sorting domain-containing protein [Bacteroidales bacterium]
MKIRRNIAILAMMLCTIPSFSQEGFFHIYPSGGSKFASSCAIETNDGSFIVAINDNLYGTGYSGSVMLLKLSAEGEVADSVIVDESNDYYTIDKLFRHPIDQNFFIGIGQYGFQDSVPTPFGFSLPYLVHFDDQLNITLRKTIEQPEYFHRKCIYNQKTMLNMDRNLFCELAYFTPTIPASDFRRIFTEMSLDGDFLRIVEDPDTIGLQNYGNSTLAVFHFPVTHEIGMLCHGRPEMTPGHVGQIHKLFKLDDDFETEELNELYRFGDDTLAYNSNHIHIRFNVLDLSSSDVLPLDDSTLLFSMRADANSYQWWYVVDSNLFVIDPSAVMFKTDLEGNMEDFYIVKSYNDSIEAVPATSVALTKKDATGHRYIYHCCYSQYQELWENPNTLTLTKLTDDFEVIWQKSYTVPDVYLEAHHLITTSDGGCLVVGSVTRGCNLPYSFGEREEWFALKLNADGTLGTDELSVRDELYGYPNPVKDVLHVGCPQGSKPTAIELYDLQGRLVRTQRTGLESIDMSQLPAGTYTMRVALEDGKVFSDKIMKQ